MQFGRPKTSPSIESDSIMLLTVEDVKVVCGGRSTPVMVDGRTPGTVDDFSINMEIFKGNIGGPMLN